MIKTISNNNKNAKLLSVDVLQIVEKRREAKGKGENDRHSKER